MDLKDKIMNVFWGRNVAKERSWEALADCIVDICQAEIHDAVGYWVSEINYYKEQVEDLELELMLSRNEFGEPSQTLNPKRRSNFK